MKQNELPIFFEQLSLLVRAGMPLPESLHHLADSLGGRQTRQRLHALGQQTADGKPFADAMQDDPTFRPFHVHLVRVGERSGFLADMLQELARYAQLHHQLFTNVRQAIAYPFLTLYIGIVILCSLSIFIVPHFAAMYDEMLAGEPLPAMTNITLALADLFYSHQPFVLIGLILLLAGVIWLLSGASSADRFISRVLQILPGYRRLMRLHDYAQFCSLIGLCMKHGMPLEDACDQVATVLQSRSLAARLRQWRDQAQEGRSLIDIAREDKRLDPLVTLTLSSAAEGVLPAALQDLAGHFRQRTDSYALRFSTGLATLVIVQTGLLIGLMVLAMFLPFLKITTALGA